MPSLPFEIVGPLDAANSQLLRQFARALAQHPWGGSALEVLAIGDVPVLLRELMPPARYQQWASERARRYAVTGAISFTDARGRSAAVIPSLNDGAMTLHFAGHEMIEAAIEARHQAEGHVWADGTHTGVAHVLWTEYVVERTRETLFRELEMPDSPLAHGDLAADAAGVEAALPDLIDEAVRTSSAPPWLFQRWFEMARLYAMSCGRADAGSLAEAAELEAFRKCRIIVECGNAWNEFDEALRDVYDRPSDAATTHDALLKQDGWQPLFDGLGDVWDPRYEAAGGA